LKWLNKKIGPPALKLSSVQELTSAKEAEEVFILGLFKDLESNGAKEFLEVASHSDDHPFGISSHEDIFSHLNLQSDAVVLFKQFDEGRNDYTKEITQDNLKKFIGTNSLPLVVDFSHEVCFLFFYLSLPLPLPHFFDVTVCQI